MASAVNSKNPYSFQQTNRNKCKRYSDEHEVPRGLFNITAWDSVLSEFPKQNIDLVPLNRIQPYSDLEKFVKTDR